jgi:hypothetical protein
MPRNWWFSVKDTGVGGIAVVEPMARDGVGGSEGRRERMEVLGSIEEGKTYYMR